MGFENFETFAVPKARTHEFCDQKLVQNVCFFFLRIVHCMSAYTRILLRCVLRRSLDRNP